MATAVFAARCFLKFLGNKNAQLPEHAEDRDKDQEECDNLDDHGSEPETGKGRAIFDL